MKNYDHRKIEKKWQKIWEKKKYGQAAAGGGKRCYLLVEFPYPSGEGLHTGHIRSYTAMDIVARKRRMEGYNVLYPIGWDAFGLPTENYAVKTGQDPRLVTRQNAGNFRRQLKSLGFSFDWSREINTSDPVYYRWTQWIFLQFFKKGLAYKAKIPINWCPKDKIGLANEEVVNGCCERCGAPVEKREKEQWLLKITAYADRLIDDLAKVDYPERIKLQQKNWIGRLRDWVFSRQRYWGEPIPLVFCDKCQKWQAVPEKELPVELPRVKKYTPTDTGESPLAKIESWVKTKCPQCGGPARRETDVMPNWAGSSWYYLRYCDPRNNKTFASLKRLRYWLPINWYNGGMEHTTLHLLYSRFWHKFLFDLGLVPTAEPYAKRTSHGVVLAADGEKMSKSRGNTVNPDEIVKRYGADTLRLYEMFLGPFAEGVHWSEVSIIGPRRFLERVWRLQRKVRGAKPSLSAGRGKVKDEALEILVHRTIKKVGDDIEAMRFNTAVSSLMILAGELEKRERVSAAHFRILLLLLAPLAPHLAEELWPTAGGRGSVHRSSWPRYDARRLRTATVTIALQINGVTRGRLAVPADTAENEVLERALKEPALKRWLLGRLPQKTFYQSNRLLNLVV